MQIGVLKKARKRNKCSPESLKNFGVRVGETPIDCQCETPSRRWFPKGGREGDPLLGRGKRDRVRSWRGINSPGERGEVLRFPCCGRSVDHLHGNGEGGLRMMTQKKYDTKKTRGRGFHSKRVERPKDLKEGVTGASIRAVGVSARS